MSQMFKSPLTTFGLASTMFRSSGQPEAAAVLSPPPPPPPPAAPTLAMPSLPGSAQVGYTPDDPRWKTLAKAGNGNTIIPPPGAAYSSTKLGG